MAPHFENNSIYTAELSPLTRAITSYLEIICFIVMVVTTIYVFAKVGVNIELVFVLSIPFIIIFIFRKIIRFFSYKIVVDSSLNKITFFRYKEIDSISVDFNEISKIKVNGYLIIQFNNNSIFYNNLQDDQLFIHLNKIKRVELGPLCSIWKPKFIKDSLKN